MPSQILPIDLVAGKVPTVTVAPWPTANRVSGNNWTNQWVHITGPIDKFIEPFAQRFSIPFTIPFSIGYALTATFEAPPGWVQASPILNQVCRLTITEDLMGERGAEMAGVPGVGPNIYVEHFEDNVDPTHPYTANFYIPTTLVAVTGLLLSWLARPYRYYVSTSVILAAGGGNVVSNQVGTTTHTHAYATTALHTGNDESGHTHSDPQGGNTGGESAAHTHLSGDATGFVTQGATGQVVNENSGGGGTWHAHTTTTTHAHGVTVTMLPGITEELTHSTIAITVDGNSIVTPTPLNATDFSILPYVSVDANGNPTTGWHSIVFTPNTRGRIAADLVVNLLLAVGGIAGTPFGAFQQNTFQPNAFQV